MVLCKGLTGFKQRSGDLGDLEQRTKIILARYAAKSVNNTLHTDIIDAIVDTFVIFPAD